MISITVPTTDIEIRDSIEVFRQRQDEMAVQRVPSAPYPVPPHQWEPMCPDSYIIEAIYTGHEMIEDRTLATRTHQVPKLLSCMGNERFPALAMLTPPCSIMGVIMICAGNRYSQPRLMTVGIAFAAVAVCSIFTVALCAIARSKEKHFRAKAKKDLRAELLEEATKTAEERIRATREDTTKTILPPIED